MDARRKRNLAINFTLAFVLTNITEMTLHECGHFVAGILTGDTPILYHNAVRHATELISKNGRIIIAAAGPIMSLIIGLLFAFLLRSRKQADAIGLFYLEMSVFGFIGVLGYTMVAPFFTYGDTGFVFRALDFPVWLILAISLLSIGILFLVLKSLAPYFVSFMSFTEGESVQTRRPVVAAMISIPVLFGTLITTLLNLPSPTPLSLIAPICIPMSLFWVYRYYLTSPAGPWGYNSNSTLAEKINWGLVVATIFIVSVNRLLAMGLQL
ncbi:MAG: hypothetical protein KF744_03505 [Taibaiella sp.]|nr:hypothetical protein [Taibaiella sp.]